MRKRLFFLLIAPLLLAACTPVGERTQMSVAYYMIAGDSFDELDQQIALHGPNVMGVGRALAATNVRMIPDFRFAQRDGQCHVQSARVSVQAHVTLPKLRSQQSFRQELAKAWDSLEHYARLHESVHVSIADTHAVRAEEAIRALPPRENCEAMRADAVALFKTMMADHQRDQLQFDREERGRIAMLVQKTRLESVPTGSETLPSAEPAVAAQ
jgi:predicted secreted Zn-dependent protease